MHSRSRARPWAVAAVHPMPPTASRVPGGAWIATAGAHHAARAQKRRAEPPAFPESSA